MPSFLELLIEEIMAGVEESQGSEKMEEGDDLRTMECLRGRLVAERQSSRAAKEQVEVMGNRIMELEKKLRQETQLKNKAEKKLHLLKRKLESLNLSSALTKTVQGSSCGSRASSCLTSSDSEAQKNPEETEAKLKISTYFLSPESSLPGAIADHKKASIDEEKEENGRTQVHGCSTSSAEDYFTDQSSFSSRSSMAGNEILDASTMPQKTGERRVSQVVDSLKHLREMVQI